MGRLRWSPAALRDIERLHALLATRDEDAAERAVGAILGGAEELIEDPRLGRSIGDGRREWVVPFGVGAYVLRYRLTPEGDPVIIRGWHSRERR